MEIKFQDKLKYQQDAINSVVNIFKGHPNPKELSPISIRTPKMISPIEGVANLWDIDPITIEENFYKVQQDNQLPVNDDLKSYDFTVEMETGTGKTYVYLRTLLELNKNYGFSKFVIVVPSVAIREGVKKTIDITRKHFSQLYPNIKYTDFIFDSSNMTDLENFMEDDNIQIMIITVQAFNSEKNIINQVMENGVIPISYITKTNPVVIIDEPQSTASTPKQKEAISNLNPLFTLQYSATPKDTTNLVYQLNAVDAYNKNLVKKIEVNAFAAADYQGKPYIRLNKVNQTKSGERKAEITLVENKSTGFNTKLCKGIKVGDKLSVKKISNNSIYDDYQVKDIVVREGDECIIFENGREIPLGLAINDINQEGVRKEQLKETIREHLNKELKLSKKNIKVLSLFFIDRVEKYRVYDDGYHNGIYADWFEKAYDEVLAENEKYKDLPKYILDVPASDVHDGYFSGDKKWINTSGETKTDNSAYEKIMRNKEKLLNPKDNLRFIFSHSALKEGWDNPNVFQICTFIDTQSDLSKRQKIGRGLRLCVDGDGNRVDESYGDGEEFKTINRLTVLANESFDSFADSLQKEMQEDGIQFNIVKEKDFKGISFIDSRGNHKITDNYDAQMIWKSLFCQNLIDKEGTILKQWDSAVIEDTIELPDDYEDIKYQIIEIVSTKSGKGYIDKVESRVTVNLNENIIETNKAFNELWDKIKFKSRYTVSLNTDDLISSCIQDMKYSLREIRKPEVRHTKTEVKIRTGVEGITKTDRRHFIEVENNDIPDIVRDLQDSTHLTRQTIIDILIKSDELDNTFEKLLINPTEYYNRTLEIIKNNLNRMLVKNIEYHKLDKQEYSLTQFKESFDEYVEDNDYIKSRLVEAKKSVYDYIKCDSNVEVKFAQDLESMEDIEFFIKLPPWFVIKTPRGDYNPDWAIAVNIDNKFETYFVIETKGSSNRQDLRETEKDKIDCGQKHFELVEELTYDVCVDYDEFSHKYIHENF